MVVVAVLTLDGEGPVGEEAGQWPPEGRGEMVDVGSPSAGDGGGADAVLEHQGPADQEARPGTEKTGRKGVRGARGWDQAREFGKAKGRQEARHRRDQERKRYPGAAVVPCRATQDFEEAGPDGGAHAERDQIPRRKDPGERGRGVVVPRGHTDGPVLSRAWLLPSIGLSIFLCIVRSVYLSSSRNLSGKNRGNNKRPIDDEYRDPHEWGREGGWSDRPTVRGVRRRGPSVRLRSPAARICMSRIWSIPIRANSVNISNNN